jgi:hypothetical protein
LLHQLKSWYGETLQMVELPYFDFTQRFQISDALYDHALLVDGKEKIDLYNLAALNGNVKAIVALYEINDQENDQKEREVAKNIITSSQNGNNDETIKLIQCAKAGDKIILSTLYEKFLSNMNNEYYANLLEKACGSVDCSVLAKCTLALIYIGRNIEEIEY